MKKLVNFVFALLILSLLAIPSPAFAASVGSSMADDTQVMWVTDLVPEMTGCTLTSGQVFDGVQVVEKVEPCPAYTFSEKREGKYKEAKARGVPNELIAPVSRDQAKNEKTYEALSAKVTEKMKADAGISPMSAMVACPIATRYKTANGGKIGVGTLYYEVQYNVSSACVAGYFYEREKKGASDTTNFCWRYTTLAGDSNPTYYVTVPTTWTAWKTKAAYVSTGVYSMKTTTSFPGCSGTGIINTSVLITET